MQTRPTLCVAIVTGANHGIGAATAVALAAGGVDVLAAYLCAEPGNSDYDRQRAQSADGVLAAIDGLPGRGAAVEADLTADGVAAELFDEAERRLGPVSILVNNASGWVADTFVPGRTGAVSPATVDDNLAVDVRVGALLIAELATRHIARDGTWGRIVGLTSGGPLGFPGQVSYGAAKAALEDYTMSASAELAAFGVTANIVHPPVTDTGWITDEIRRRHRVVDPDDVGEVIAWLCSDAARLVTGNVIHLR